MRAGGTTPDGVFTLDEAECLADCDRTLCVQVNHRYVGAQTPESFDALLDDLRAGRLGETVPPHGTLVRVRRSVGLQADRAAIVAERAKEAEAKAARAAATAGAGEQQGLMAITDAPKIVTARLGYDDSHTLERYLATGGYSGLRKALDHDARGGGGRGRRGQPARAGAAPASRPGGSGRCCRKNPVTYLVINGDESEPATFKDHMLIEGDPHQILEGVLISAYALQVSQAFIYIRGEFALGLERMQQAVNDAYAPRRRRRRTSSARASRSTSSCTRAPAPTSAARRRRSSSRSRASAASRASSRRSSPPPSGSTASRRWSTTSRRWPTSRGS